MNATEVAALKTPELVALYNKATGKTIKKFSSRAAGEKQVVAALAKNPVAAGADAPKMRRVKGSAGAAEAGRPIKSFTVKVLPVAKATSKPNENSLRKQMLNWLNDPAQGGAATIEAIEAQFKRNMRGVVNKLEEKDWIEKVVTPV